MRKTTQSGITANNSGTWRGRGGRYALAVNRWLLTHDDVLRISEDAGANFNLQDQKAVWGLIRCPWHGIPLFGTIAVW